MMRKLITITMLAVLSATLMLGCSRKDGEVLVGIGQFAEHGSLDNCREGFIAGLEEAGYKEDENLKILYENSQTDANIASQISKNFIARDVDLICAIATTMAESAYGATKNSKTPVIFTAVTDPIKAGLAKEDGTPSGNITGTSDKLPVEKQLEMIRRVLPNAKKIGIMYTTSEVNSLSAIEEYKAVAESYGFEIVESGISTIADVPLATDSLLEKVDCINNLTDNTVVSALSTILNKASKKNIAVFGSEVEQVKIGCLASMGLDYFELGKRTGKMAAQVLGGEKKASEINFEIVEEFAFYGNNEVARSLGITLPEDLVEGSKVIYETIAE
jgi:putative ABC transport system substrate-binding protein